MSNSKKYFTTAIGNSIIDVLAFVEDDFLIDNSFTKGAMTLIDQKNASALTKVKYNQIQAGGSAANTIVTMANFGIKNSFIGKVGSGNYGTLFEDQLTNNKVDFHCKHKSKFGSTARSFILITPDKERTMCTYLGESANIADEVDLNVIKNSEILYIEGYLWHEKPIIEALEKAIICARENQTKIAFTLCDGGWVDMHRDDFLKITNIADYVFANENEIKALTKSDQIDYDKIKELGENNPKLTLIITRSDMPAIIYTANNHKFTKVTGNKVDNLKDATGAGDAFAAGFLYGVKQGFNVEKSAQIGHLFACNVIQIVGGRLTKEQITNIDKHLLGSLYNVQSN